MPARKFALWILAAAILAAALLKLESCGRPAPARQQQQEAPRVAVGTAPVTGEFVRELPPPPPEVLLVALSRRRAAYLLKQLYKERPDAMGRPFEVLEASPSDTAKVAAELARVRRRKIRFVAIDGDVSEPGDPLVAPELKKLTKSGVYTTGIEFVE